MKSGPLLIILKPDLSRNLFGFFPADCLKFNNKFLGKPSIKINGLSPFSDQPLNNYKETQAIPTHGPAGTRIAEKW
jgi:hypothetical protein